MELKKYEILILGMIFTALSCVILCGKAEAQERKYPNKPIEVIVWAPGGSIDLATRTINDELAKELGVPISIQYKGGALGVNAASYFSTVKPDGYTFLSSSNGPFINAPVMEKVPYDPLKDFIPLAHYAITAQILMSHSSSEFTSFDAVVKFAKEKPGTLNCATTATSTNLLLQVMKMHGVDMTAVPMKSGPDGLAAILGKHVDLILTGYQPIVIPHLRSGQLRILAITNKLSQEPGVPIMTEKGFPEAKSFGIWYGYFAPKNLPKPILDQVSNSLQKVIQMPSIGTAIGKLGLTATYKGPDEFKKMIAEDYSVMRKIGEKLGFGK
jgi:tripartite-type tricarboxylate transporter receptor subunit TctC